MNELLAQAYGTAQETDTSIEKTAEAALLDELEKVASQEGIDLSELSDDDIVDILSEVLEEGSEKTAAAGSDNTEVVTSNDDDAQQKLAEADFLGRTMAHAFYNELNEISEHVTKTASDTTEEDTTTTTTGSVEDLAMARAEEILTAAAEALETNTTKTSSVQQVLAEKLANKTENVDEDTITARALEILDANDYDVEAIAELLG
tara:strand:- start:490 stop:1104 length:615 start_codon:yes stop_codon:yes gene_type:complete